MHRRAKILRTGLFLIPPPNVDSRYLKRENDSFQPKIPHAPAPMANFESLCQECQMKISELKFSVYLTKTVIMSKNYLALTPLLVAALIANANAHRELSEWTVSGSALLRHSNLSEGAIGLAVKKIQKITVGQMMLLWPVLNPVKHVLTVLTKKVTKLKYEVGNSKVVNGLTRRIAAKILMVMMPL